MARLLRNRLIDHTPTLLAVLALVITVASWSVITSFEAQADSSSFGASADTYLKEE